MNLLPPFGRDLLRGILAFVFPIFLRISVTGFLATGMLVAAVLATVTPVSASGSEAPDPADGQWAAATMALLHHQKDTCDVLAVRVLDHWRTLPTVEATENDEERIREYVLAAQISDLAASRRAGDLVDRFLPGVRAETNAETSASLRRLHDLITELCDGVALPVAPKERFEEKITEILDRIEVEQAELGRLLVVPTEVEQAALEPYLLPIQIAGIEAEGEYLAYLESLRPKEREPTIQERMAAWHRAIYTPAVTPAKKAFGTYLSARQKKDARGMARACREISSTVSVLLRSDEAFESPDPRLSDPLRRIYVAMRQMSRECSAGRAREIERRFTELQAKLQDAGKQMARYRLSP